MTNPKLRFRSADGSLFEDWKSVKVGDIAETCGGGTPATGNASYWGGSIQWLTPTEINTKYVHRVNDDNAGWFKKFQRKTLA